MPKAEPPQTSEIAPAKTLSPPSKADNSPAKADATPVPPVKVDTPPVPPPKVDYATDLFNMLTMDASPSETGSKSSSADDNAWAGFQCEFYFLFS